MDKFFLILAFLSLAGCYYFFFIEIDLMYGSISYILTVTLNIIYAIQSTNNKLPDDYDPEKYSELIKK